MADTTTGSQNNQDLLDREEAELPEVGGEDAGPAAESAGAADVPPSADSVGETPHAAAAPPVAAEAPAPEPTAQPTSQPTAQPAPGGEPDAESAPNETGEAAADAAAPAPEGTAEGVTDLEDEAADEAEDEVEDEADAGEEREGEGEGEGEGKEEEEEEEEQEPDLASELAPPISPATGDAVLLNDRYAIYPSQPLPELSTPSGRAFTTEDRTSPGNAVYAVVCIPGLPVRLDCIDAIVEDSIPGNLALLTADTVYWPPYDQKCLILIYERPLGGRVSKVLGSKIQEFKKQHIIQNVIESVADAIKQLGARGIVHRAIRADNIYFLDADQEIVVLGEFVSAPPGFDQPVIYETIERGMAEPGARGTGTPADDYYAFGVTLAVLLRGGKPGRDQKPKEILHHKINENSYQMVVGRAPISATLLDPLRGMLNDDIEQRWGGEQIEYWLTGRRVRPGQSKTVARSQRGLKFGEHEHHTVRSLARAMSSDPEGAIRLIKEDKLEQWLNRGLEDKDLAGSVAAALEMSRARRDQANADDILLARVLSLLDPDGPIRYRGYAFMPDGFGAALAVEKLRGGDVNRLVEAVTREIPEIWMDVQPAWFPPGTGFDKMFNEARNFLNLAAPGFGLERCLYELNSGLPCQSPAIKKEYVVEIEELLAALDAAEAGADRKSLPVDRHVAAFIATRYDEDIERNLGEMANPDEALAIIGQLRLLSLLQERLGPETLGGLAKWMGDMLGPAVNLFQSRITRRDIESQIPRLVRQGSLPDILDLIDDRERRAQDSIDFDAAVAEFRAAEAEIADIEERTRPGSDELLKSSRQSAAIVSILIMVFVVSLLIMTG